jgi:hypothetical protein
MDFLEDVIGNQGGDNDAGLKRTIAVCRYDDIDLSAWPALAAGGMYADKVTYDAAFAHIVGKKFWKFTVTVDKGSKLDSESAGSKGSLSAINNLTMVRVKIDATGAGWLEQHKNDELLFIVEELSGELRVVGDKDLPAMIKEFKLEGGGQVGDDKMLTMTVEAPGRIAKWYTGQAISYTPAV